MRRPLPLALVFALLGACGEAEAEPAVALAAPVASASPPSGSDLEASAEPASPRASFQGDPATREREILDLSRAELDDDLLLSLPGSGGRALDGATGSTVVPDGGVSIGSPQAGRLSRGIELPLRPDLYTRRDPSRSYATSETVRTILAALTTLRREKKVGAEVIIGDLSLPRGGWFPPHVSHQSGRDIDIRLVVAPGLDRATLPLQADQVDWDAVWALVHSFLETGRVTYVFLDFGRQADLMRAAERAGVHARVIDRWFQWPDRGDAQGIIRHEDGHLAHVHIRLSCGPEDTRCHGS